MVKINKRKIYNSIVNCPNWVNKLIDKLLISPDILYGKAFRQYYSFLANNWKHYDNSKELINMVNYALRNVPYYRKRYSIDEISSVSMFKSIFKTIDKNDVNFNHENLISKSVDLSKYELGTTSGTSGRSLKMYLPQSRYITELATKYKLWSQVGYNYSKKGFMRMAKLKDNQDYQFDPIQRNFVFDGFRLNEDYFFKIYNIMKKNNVKFFHCYTSTGYEFAKFLEKNNLNHSFLTAFISSSENVYDFQEHLFEKLDIKHFNFYGHTEKIAIGGYCAKSRNYHIEPTYGYGEILDENNNPVTKKGEIGEIVVTTTNNFAMPLIRYRTGDFAEYYGDFCEKCGRRLLVLSKIIGRNGEKIYNLDGSFVSTTSLTLHGDILNKINGIQFVQKKIGLLKILIIPKTEFNESDRDFLISHFRKRFNHDMKLELQYTKNLIRKKNGKFLLLISEVEKNIK